MMRDYRQMACGDGMCWQGPLCEVIDELKAENERLREAVAFVAAELGPEARRIQGHSEGHLAPLRERLLAAVSRTISQPEERDVRS